MHKEYGHKLLKITLLLLVMKENSDGKYYRMFGITERSHIETIRKTGTQASRIPQMSERVTGMKYNQEMQFYLHAF